MATDNAFEDAVHTTLVHRRRYLQMLVLLTVLLLTLRERSAASSHDGGKKNDEIYLRLPLFLQNASRIENCVQTLFSKNSGRPDD